MRINKYTEMYNAFLRSLVDLHNAHIAYEHRQGRTTTKELRAQFKIVREQIDPLRQEAQRIQRQINIEKSERFRELQELKKGKQDE